MKLKTGLRTECLASNLLVSRQAYHRCEQAVNTSDIFQSVVRRHSLSSVLFWMNCFLCFVSGADERSLFGHQLKNHMVHFLYLGLRFICTAHFSVETAHNILCVLARELFILKSLIRTEITCKNRIVQLKLYLVELYQMISNPFRSSKVESWIQSSERTDFQHGVEWFIIHSIELLSLFDQISEMNCKASGQQLQDIAGRYDC